MRIARRRMLASMVPPLLAVLAAGIVAPARAAETLNAYSILPENWARPMFEELEKATGIRGPLPPAGL